MSQTPGDHEPTTALRHLHADTPRYGTLTLTLRRKSPLARGGFTRSSQHSRFGRLRRPCRFRRTVFGLGVG